MANFDDSNSVRNYMDEINKFPIFSIEKQKELAHLYLENHDLQAKKLLIESNLKLVVSVAKKYCYRVKHLSFLDLIQEGNVALVYAIDHYDPTKSAFSTYLTESLNRDIARSIANVELEIRKPDNIVRNMVKYKRLMFEYQKRREPLPDDKTICDILNITAITLDNIKIAINQNAMSLYEPIAEDMTIADLIPDTNCDTDKVLDKINNYELFVIVKEILTPCEYYIFYNNILSNKEVTLSTIANSLEISGERVRQKIIRSSKKLKPYFKENSTIYGILLKKVKEREQDKFPFLRLIPISPQDIVKYLYIQDELTSVEKQLYSLIKFGKYNYSKEELMTILKLSIQEYEVIMSSLKDKMKIKFQDLKAYKTFEEDILKSYQTSIFDLIIDNSNDLIRKK